MADGGAFLEKQTGDGGMVLAAHGNWRVESATALDRALAELGTAPGGGVRFDLGGIEGLDTVGAFLLLRAANALDATLENVPPGFATLLHHVEKAVAKEPARARRRHRHFNIAEWLDHFGAQVFRIGDNALELLSFFGLVLVTAGRLARHPSHIRPVALMAQLQRNGWAAMPIVGMLAFLIGVVIAYQGADQLAQFGAQILTVNLLGVSILRELGCLITAIIVAGRSGSAFTAEIGAMRVNEEVDAMQVLGLDPIEVLVMPRLLGLLISLPLLTFFANFVAMVGGGVMCWVALDITPPVFLEQLKGALNPLTFWLGVIKAPFFAFVIAMVGCHAGLEVERSAESVGHYTTASVVRSIFLVLLIDAAFSILFAALHV
ncbi:MAG TPA: MlaE family lipid ABC transporter permease subunit [Stellaceae bacterium]